MLCDPCNVCQWRKAPDVGPSGACFQAKVAQHDVAGVCAVPPTLRHCQNALSFLLMAAQQIRMHTGAYHDSIAMFYRCQPSQELIFSLSDCHREALNDTSQAWLRALIRSTLDVVLPTAQPCSSTSCTDPPHPHAVSSSTASWAACTCHPVAVMLYIPPAHVGPWFGGHPRLTTAAVWLLAQLSRACWLHSTSASCTFGHLKDTAHQVASPTAVGYSHTPTLELWPKPQGGALRRCARHVRRCDVARRQPPPPPGPPQPRLHRHAVPACMCKTTSCCTRC